ncbi:glycosyltransferase family 4 protein [Chryseobacterium sp. NEB161]|nr:glycosyltransferase family 4 protein [Chryseobacterium sp. NEB161]
MKILHIAEPFATGVLSFLLDLTKRQVEKHEVYIIYGVRPLTPHNVEDLFDKRIHLIKLDSFKGPVGSVVNPGSYIKIHQLYKKIAPDIVHLHSSAAGFIGRWCLPASKVKIFYTPHGFSFLKEDGSEISRKLFLFTEKISAKRNSKIIACSYGEYTEAKKLTANSTYVNNGINTLPLKPYETDLNFSNNKNITVCTSGRILYQKNPTLFNQIAELLPETNFVWIGEGELKTELASPNIRVTGWITRDKALKILSESQFFILPSRWEGLSISLLEAMYLKKVCLVSNVIGNRDVIRNNENGFICNTAEEYAQNIRNIINGISDASLITENSHQDVNQLYNIDLMADSYSKIYNEK